MDDSETSVSNTSGEKYEANKVSVTIPPFSEEKPEIWFFQVEAQFSIANITQDQTNFNYLVAQLEPKVVENIWDIIQSERNDKYVAGKERLLSTFKESEEKNIPKLLTGISLGDMKPSQLLRKMKSLGGTNITDKVLRTLWLGKMPESIKNILVESNENLDNLSIMADKIFEMNSTTEIYSAAVDNFVMNTVLDKISNFEKQISELNVHRQSRSKYRHSGFNRSKNRSHSRKKYSGISL
ncbi:hypothetical protein AVEN_188682-1 [Araneus ventricosus]|uniref:DUF7041 domain-containing protein n=1 Tax=Araneus ventricosus TaxID=182803 RepID=A0A4Y2D6U8_ARAVE|nr:hypothetical protein AVEN_188682-1 [Araneus ventricosus]